MCDVDEPTIHLLDSVNHEVFQTKDDLFTMIKKELGTPDAPMKIVTGREMAGSVETLRLATPPSQYTGHEGEIWSEGLNFAITKVLELLSK